MLAAVGAYLAVRNELRGQIDETLTSRSQIARDVIATAGAMPDGLPQVSELPGPLESQLPLPPGGDSIAFIRRITPAGEAQQLPATSATLPISEEAQRIAESGSGEMLADQELENVHMRVLTVGAGERGAIQVAASLEGVDDVLADLQVILVLLCLGGIALAALLARALANRIVGPIRDLGETAEHIGATDDLSRRIAVESDDEVGRLATRFNSMLDAIERSQAALTRSLTAQSQLVADASHELRTPISSLRTDVESLIAHPELEEPERRRRLASVEARAEELTALVNDVIELARGDSPAGEPEEVRLDELARESAQWLGRHAPERELQLELEPSVVLVRADRAGRAINNLLDNAHKYSPPERPIELSISGGELSVRDHGAGIPEDELAHVFDRFWRGSAERDVAGSGLGLAIVKQVAEAHGGSVEAEAAPGGGTIFRLSLPEANGSAESRPQ